MESIKTLFINGKERNEVKVPKFVNEKFKKDKDIALAAVESVGEDAMDLIDESLRKDDDILNALSQHDY